MYRSTLALFVLVAIFLPSSTAPAASENASEAWQPSGTLYLDGHVKAYFCKKHEIGTRLPHVRETLRQGFLMEAYRTLGLLPREEWLGDAFPEAETDRPVIACRIDAKHKMTNNIKKPLKIRAQATVTLVRETLQDSKNRDKEVRYEIGYQPKKNPKTQKPIIPSTTRETGKLLKEATFGYAPYRMRISAPSACKLIREELLPALEEEIKQDPNFKPSPLKTSDAPVPESVRELLHDMNFVSQYSAIRQLHTLEQTQGQSPQIMAALARGYANLSVLTNHYWGPVHNAFAGRAIWYAENIPEEGEMKVPEEMKAPTETIPTAIWRNVNRLYVLGILGYHQETIEVRHVITKDLTKIDKASRPTLPPWIPLIVAYCNYDVRKLQGDQIPEDERELAAVLELFCMDEGNNLAETSDYASEATAKLIEMMPDCYRLYGTIDYGGLSGMRLRAELPAAVLKATLYDQIARIPDAPEPVVTIAEDRPDEEAQQLLALGGSDNDFKDRQKLYRTLLGTLKEKNDSSNFLAKDENPLSWATLGLLVREISYLQARYQAILPTMTYGIDLPKEKLMEYLPLYEDHPHAEYMETWIEGDLATKREFYKEIVERWPTNDMFHQSPDFRVVPRRYREIENLMYRYAYFPVKALHEESRHAATRMAKKNTNHCTRDFSIMLGVLGKGELQSKMARVLLEVSPHSPLARSYQASYQWDVVKGQAETWEKKAFGFPGLLARLGQQYWNEGKMDDALRCFKAANAQLPQYIIVRRLAQLYYEKEDYDNWQKTLEDFLQDPGPGLNYALANAAMADGFLQRYQWEKALPYAERAADSYSARGLLCAAACYEGLREFDEAEKYYKACALRYRNTPEYWIDFCVRTGQGDFEGAERVLKEAVDREKKLHPNQLDFYNLSPSYFMIHDTDNYLRYLQQLPPAPWNYWMQFGVYLERGDTEKRDQALKAAIDLNNNALPHVNTLMKMFQDDLAAGGKADLDTEKIDRLLAFSPEQERVNIKYFLGCYYDACGKPKEAIQCWKKCLGSYRIYSMRRTQSGVALRKRNVSLDDMDRITEDLIKDEARWKEMRKKDEAAK